VDILNYEKCKKELEKFMLDVGVGQIIFEKKPNGDLIICKQETELLKK
jgi:hypothetical protein